MRKRLFKVIVRTRLIVSKVAKGWRLVESAFIKPKVAQLCLSILIVHWVFHRIKIILKNYKGLFSVSFESFLSVNSCIHLMGKDITLSLVVINFSKSDWNFQWKGTLLEDWWKAQFFAGTYSYKLAQQFLYFKIARGSLVNAQSDR